jgi:hypothetical protein
MSSSHRDELEATLAARRELGPEHDDHLVAGFLDRIDKDLDRRIDARLARRKAPTRSSHHNAFVITLTSLGVSIPLLGIASGSIVAMALVLAALVAVNAIVWNR